MFELTYDTRHRTILTYTTFKIIGLVLLGISQVSLALYAALFTSVIPADEIKSSESAFDIFGLIISVISGDMSGETQVVSSYKSLIFMWPEIKRVFAYGKVVPIFLLIGLFSNLVQERKSIKRTILKYAIFTVAFYLAELIGYYFFLFPMIEALGESYALDATTIALAEVGVNSLMHIFANFNIFIDLLLCSLFFFFVIYTPKKGFFSRHKKFFRSLVSIPILYLVISIIFTFLGKDKIEIPLPIMALFSSRGIYAHLFFYVMTIYYKFRRIIYNKNPNNNGLDFKHYLKTQSSKLDFALIMGLVMLVICLFERMFNDLTVAKVYNFSLFSLGRGIHLYSFVFLLLFFNFAKRPRFKVFNVLYVIYYLALAFLLAALYAVVIDYAMAVLKVISNAIEGLGA